MPTYAVFKEQRPTPDGPDAEWDGLLWACLNDGVEAESDVKAIEAALGREPADGETFFATSYFRPRTAVVKTERRWT